jgi:quinol monooxygenase YgiN
MQGLEIMYITLTRSQGTQEQLHQAAEFLGKFLPRLKRQAGVLAIYHFDRPDKGDDFTIIVWENEDAVKAYRQGELVKEALAFEQAHGLPATREGYPLMLAVSSEF